MDLLIRRVTKEGERGEISPVFFWKLGKSALILGKNAQITVIYGLNFSSKVQFLKVSQVKNGYFSRRGLFFYSLALKNPGYAPAIIANII